MNPARIALALLLASAAPAAAQAPVRIGLSAPLTGADAAFGQGMRLAAEQAVADLNRAGRRLVLVMADDAGDARQGAAVARKFAADGVRLVVGPLESSVAAAAAPVYEDAGIVAVTPGATWPTLTRRGHWNLFRTVPDDAQQGAAAGAYLVAREAGRRIGIVHDRTAFGRGLADAVSAAIKAAGNPEAAFEGVSRGTRDLGELAGRLKAARVEAVYFGGLAPEAAALVRALREAGLAAPLVASDGILDRDFSTLAGAAGEGTVMTLAPDRRLPDVKGKPPRGPEAEALAGPVYAAVEVLAQALDRAKAADGRKLAEALRAGPFRTAGGEIAFDANGDPRPGGVTLRVWRRTPDGRLDYAGNEVAP